MLKRLAQAWFGYFSWPELKKFLMLAAIFFCTIGVYWPLRVTKDSVFNTMISLDYQWVAKLVSVAVVFPLVLGYNFLVDQFPRHRVFYVLGGLYTGLLLLFYFILKDPTYGLSNTEASPFRMLGWTFYVFAESFGSLMVALFWSFAADVATPKSAKSGYFLVAMGGQVGSILGSYLTWKYTAGLGTESIVLGCAVFVAMIPLLIWVMRQVIPENEMAKYQASSAGEKATDKASKPKSKTRIGDSIALMFKYPYLMGIFGVVAFFEIAVTIFDYRFKTIAKSFFSGDALTSYFGFYAVLVNVVAFIALVGGIGNIGRRLGLKVSLSMLPIAIGVVSLLMYSPHHFGSLFGFESPSLTLALSVMVFAKALNYALNQPSKEQLYIPTTYEAKYKTKAFLEMFGSRGSKGLGSLFNGAATYFPAYFALASTCIALGISGVWLLVALYLGNRHREAVENDEVVC